MQSVNRYWIEPLEPRVFLAFDTNIPRIPGEYHFYADAALHTSGLVGTFVDQSLRADSDRGDWRVSQPVSGTRIDTNFDLTGAEWGNRAAVGLTHGNDSGWGDFSVQWDGYLQIVTSALGLNASAFSGSRLYVDLNRDGNFDAGEVADNGWGSLHDWTAARSPRLDAGVYAVRIQYEADELVNSFQVTANPAPMVRVAYLVPSNRTPQDGATDALRDGVRWMQQWYSDQMDRNGFGPRTIRYETESDGVTPKVYTVRVGVTDADIRRDLWSSTLAAAGDAGVPVFADGQNWLLVPESHLELSDGSVVGDGSLGSDAGTGYATDGGAAVISGNLIPWLTPGFLTDDRAYLGMKLPGIGPYPLGPAPWYDGTTVSQRSSGAHGALVHELTHGMGLPHEFVNDDNAHGNIMGNGFRGFRGAAYPFRYGGDDAYLSYAQALALSTSPFLNPEADASAEQSLPQISEITAGTIDLSAGQVGIHFHATDDASLAAAILTRGGDIVGQMPLSGRVFDGTIRTPYFDAGAAADYAVTVYDVNGNRSQRITQVTPRAGPNRAPRPFLHVTPSTIEVNQSAFLDATKSVDPEGGALRTEWDLGDGAFGPISAPGSLGANKRFTVPGVYEIRVRLTDASGASSVSSPVPLRVLPPGPTLVSSIVNDGASTQRSTVRGLTLTFDRPVTLLPNAVRLTLRGGAATGLVVSNPSGDRETYRLTFATADGALSDGMYDLRISNTGVVADAYLAQPLSGGTRTVTFHRLLGDLDGDGVVGVNDVALMRRIMATPMAAGAAPDGYDLNGDGLLSAIDLAILRLRLRRRV